MTAKLGIMDRHEIVNLANRGDWKQLMKKVSVAVAPAILSVAIFFYIAPIITSILGILTLGSLGSLAFILKLAYDVVPVVVQEVYLAPSRIAVEALQDAREELVGLAQRLRHDYYPGTGPTVLGQMLMDELEEAHNLSAPIQADKGQLSQAQFYNWIRENVPSLRTHSNQRVHTLLQAANIHVPLPVIA